MESIDHFSHQHPLVLVDQEPGVHGSRKGFCSGCNEAVLGCYCYGCRKVAEGYCSGCEKELEGSSYGCGECGFFLHKKCAELQTEIINHPLHSEHRLTLRLEDRARDGCNVCWKDCRIFYGCDSCKFYLDPTCAMHPQFVALEFQKLSHISHHHPLILVEDIEFPSYGKVCLGCTKPMYKSSPFYCCPYCKFHLHKKCAELPLKINSSVHRNHPLKLLAKPVPPHEETYRCRLCAESKGFVYYCSLCEFDFKAADASLQTITAEIHEHPLNPIWGTMSFVCNACGTDGNHVCFICAECSLIIHIDCTSLRRTIKITRHPHRLSHIYYFQDEAAAKRECNICHDDINLGYGSYCCSDCKYFAHVNCAIDTELLQDEKSELSDDLIAISPAFQEIKPGEIKHFSHKHNLILSDDGVEDGQSCEGCMRSISTSFYYCAQCNFFLCKCCVHEFPKKMRHWSSSDLQELFFYSIFRCSDCGFWSSGFGYICKADCNWIMCIRCHEILDTRIVNIEGHEHLLFFDHNYEGECCGCGGSWASFRCKDKKCNLCLNYRCLLLPETARCKYDDHALQLTYHDDHDLSQCHCDICEEYRDPKQWFYHCADCDVSAHLNCVLRQSPFVKLGKPFRIDDHEHPVTLVKIDFYPPKCNECGKPCRDDLSIQCPEPDCTYIFHWDCYRNGPSFGKSDLLHTD
ncbi:hypothetical protein SLE2022_278020 [Rubroshorea leprosula]